MVPFTRRTMLKVGLTALLIPDALSGCGRRAADRSFEDWRREFESRVQDRMRACSARTIAVQSYY
ncbi:hypothetical protein [Mycobacteroides sp. LB1]|uniref:hypothetical protein n=1 Tax=Mycobacteroides sp. LB1 TaxID=2750814 RepID=UPI0015DD9F9E|nr:hypothetical protein [Mycobacteroides sp. LB1]